MLSQCRSLEVLQIRPHLTVLIQTRSLLPAWDVGESVVSWLQLLFQAPHQLFSLPSSKPNFTRPQQQCTNPQVKGAPNNTENQHCDFTQATPVSPFLRDVASRQPKLITNSRGFFSPHHHFGHKMLFNDAETRILPSSLMKFKVKQTAIKDGLCTHASLKG